jgi:hypothetical protein
MIAAPRIEVACGRSARVSRTLRAPCRVLVGSSSACDLRVVGRGVRAHHLAIEWDGERLVIVKTEGSGPVQVDGLSVLPPFPIVGSVRVRIGEAELQATAPLASEDDRTLVMVDSDRTEVPPRPAMAFDTTTTRVHLRRLRLDGVLKGRARGRIVALLAAGALAVVVVLPVELPRVGTGKAAAVSGGRAAPAHSVETPGRVVEGTEPSPAVATPVVPAVAAALLVSGRRDDAADAYAALAAARRGDSVFRVLARILAREKSQRIEHPRPPPERAP